MPGQSTHAGKVHDSRGAASLLDNPEHRSPIDTSDGTLCYSAAMEAAATPATANKASPKKDKAKVESEEWC